ncbi:ribosomal RNA small subunit methyltransferase A [Candidatus Saccharibacteria bacterium]|nr:ribosomal RNA small subunit methyltransferase A [Candidatus Saccharibacteria bacterium]
MKNKKSLGQNWLKDRIILDDIALLASDGVKSKTCLEIGPGLGTLTSALLRQFEKVIAVEFDENLAKNLPKSFPGKNLVVKNEDFLKFDMDGFEKPFVVAGNIPYYITSPIIEKLLNSKNLPERIVLLIQKEVAERISAEKGKNSLLSLLVQNRATVTLGPVISREYFTPAPKVDSQIIILDPKKPEVSEKVLNLAKIGFKMPRKKLVANLSASGIVSREKAIESLKSLHLSENIRAEELTLNDWQKLSDILI